MTNIVWQVFFAHLSSDLLRFVTIRTLFQTSILGQKNQGYELKNNQIEKMANYVKMSEISREINVAFSRVFLKFKNPNLHFRPKISHQFQNLYSVRGTRESQRSVHFPSLGVDAST